MELFVKRENTIGTLESLSASGILTPVFPQNCHTSRNASDLDKPRNQVYSRLQGLLTLCPRFSFVYFTCSAMMANQPSLSMKGVLPSAGDHLRFLAEECYWYAAVT